MGWGKFAIFDKRVVVSKTVQDTYRHDVVTMKVAYDVESRIEW